jgi:hypothetical protein
MYSSIFFFPSPPYLFILHHYCSLLSGRRQNRDFYAQLENEERLRLEAKELDELFAELDAETAAKKGKQ